MNNNDFKYILKRVLIFIIISILLFCFNSCIAKADSINPSILQYYKPNRNLTWTRSPVKFTQQGQDFYHTSTTSINDIAGLYGIVNNQISGTYFSFNALVPPHDFWVVGELQLLNGSFVACETNAYTAGGTETGFYTFTCEVKQSVQVYKYGIYLTSTTGYGETENSVSISALNGFSDKGEYNQYLINLQQSIIGVESKIDANTQALNDINNSINDTTPVSNNEVSGNTNQWSNNNLSNGTITQLVTLPITLIQAYLNGINSTCNQFNLGSLFGTDLILPCINVANYLGTSLWSTIDILFSGFMILNIARKLIKIFNDFTNLNSNQAEELYGGGA